MGAEINLAVWTQDEAGPFQTIPMPGHSWQEDGLAKHQQHEYIRNGTAKLLTLFCPSSGEVRAKGVTTCPNTVLHAWLESELTKVLAGLPLATSLEPKVNRQHWRSWQEGLQLPITLSAELPPLRMLLVMDNLMGHKTPAFVLWLFANGIMPLYTPFRDHGSICANRCRGLLNGGRWNVSIHKVPEKLSDCSKRRSEAGIGSRRHLNGAGKEQPDVGEVGSVAIG